MIKLEKLRKLLLDGVLLSKETFNIDDIDQVLDDRDVEFFDSEWMRNYNVIKQRNEVASLEAEKLIESIREISYKTTYDATQSSDLAAYISDDFELISKALILNYNDSWINALGKEYSEGRIPCGKLKCLNVELNKLILKE